MSDPLRIEPDYIGWAAYYDPEGPVGRGKTREAAVLDLIHTCDDDHSEGLLLSAICALEAKLADALVRLEGDVRVQQQRDQFAREADELRTSLSEAAIREEGLRRTLFLISQKDRMTSTHTLAQIAYQQVCERASEALIYFPPPEAA